MQSYPCMILFIALIVVPLLINILSLFSIPPLSLCSFSLSQIEAAYQSKLEKVNLDQGFCRSRPGEYTIHFLTKPAPKAKKTNARQHAAGQQAGSQHAAQQDGDDNADAADFFAPAASASSSSDSTPITRPIPAFIQINNHSRMQRKVRRLANDDDATFITIPPSECIRGEKCNICAEEYWEEEEADDKQKSQLPSAADSNPSSQSDLSSQLSSSSSSAPTSATPSISSCLGLHPSNTWPESNTSCVKLVKCMPGHSFHRDCIAQWIKLKDACPCCHTKI